MKKTKIPALWNLLSSEVRQMTNNHSKQHVRKQDVLWKKENREQGKRYERYRSPAGEEWIASLWGGQGHREATYK